MQNDADHTRVTHAVLIVGLIVLILGLQYLAGSLYGYFWMVPEERDEVSEAAEEMGLAEIPGVSLDSTARFFILNIVIGCVMVAMGVTMTAIAALRMRKKRET